MHSKQIIGPVNAGTEIVVSLDEGYQILQIGVEHPCSTPIQEYIDTAGQDFNFEIEINGIRYVIFDNDILEIPGNYNNQVIFNFPSNFDALSIIDILFKNENEE